jgi:DNA repair exonuclease SbcCD ATPase subunit
MSDLYLTKIAINDFRTFGKLDLDLPPAPGITLVVGPNGLGKSSFFDSIEWALTGTIRRFEEYLKKKLPEEAYLTRRGAPEDSHNVSLNFGNHVVFRDANIEPETDSVIELLRSRVWGSPIQDLSLYLAFTHFLGQASNQRFTSRGREEQWSAVKGPSGIDRLEEVRNALSGRATVNAFNRRIERDSKEVEECKERLTSWQVLMARAATLHQIADAAGALSIGDVLEDVARLESRGALLSDEGLARSAFPSTPRSQGIDRLSALRRSLEAARGAREQRLVVISGLVQTTNEYSAIRKAADAGSPAVDLAKAAVDQLTEARLDLTRAIAKKQEAVRKTRTDLSTQQNRLALLKRATADYQSLEENQTVLKATEEELGQTERSLNRLLKEQAELRAEIDSGRLLEATLTAAMSTLERTNVFSRRVREVEAATERYQESERLADQARRNSAALVEQREVLRQRIDALEDELASAQVEVTRASERVSEILAAISMIAVHISETDTECPLCHSEFPRGELQTLIRASTEQGDQALAIAQESLSKKSQELQRAEAELRSVVERQEKLQVEMRNAENQRANLSELRSEVASQLDISIEQDFALAAAERQTRANEIVHQARAAFEAFTRQVPQKTARFQQLGIDIQSLQRTSTLITQRREIAQREVRSTTERLRLQGRQSDSADQLGQSVAEQEHELGTLESLNEETARELENLAADEALLSKRLQEAQAQLNAREAEMESASKNAAAIEAQWKAASMGGLPNAASLTKRRTEIAKEIEEIDLLLTEQVRLVESYQKALQNEELKSVTAQLENVGGAGAAINPQTYESALSQRLRDAESKQHNSENAKATVAALGETLQKAASDFSTRFLLPLNDLIDQFNEALLSYPGETIRFKASHHLNRTQFDMQLRYRDQIDDALYNTQQNIQLPPQIVLSEGQLAANGFSILCAASVAYPWSKWKALLLDDPLQHNDIIHAAAFVDLMRNLVERKGYQLLMSSHERSEAEFISRKFDAAGIACSVLELTAPSRTGVNYISPRYNQAAKAAMRTA